MASTATAITKETAGFADGTVADALLRDLRIASSVLCRSVMAAPWGFSIRARDVATFHLVLAGEGWLSLEGSTDGMRLCPGDVVVLPHGDGHRVTDAPGSSAPPLTDLLAEHPVVDGELRFGGRSGGNGSGGSGPTAEIVCGTFALQGGDPPPWFARLPSVVHSARGSAGGEWRGALTAALRDEAGSPTPGGAAVVNRWLEAIVSDALGASTAHGSDGVDDERIGRVLSLVRERPAAAWTLATLADAAAMSRSAFAERFGALTGEAPGAYVRRQRLAHARRLIETTDATLAEIAARVGYGSEAALSRAFKAAFGTAPSAHRRRRPSRRADPDQGARTS